MWLQSLKQTPREWPLEFQKRGPRSTNGVTASLKSVRLSRKPWKRRYKNQNLKNICERESPGQYSIEIVDVSKHPRAAIENNLIALPASFALFVLRFKGSSGTGWAKTMLVGFGLIVHGLVGRYGDWVRSGLAKNQDAARSFDVRDEGPL
jgi:hypothetical protein